MFEIFKTNVQNFGQANNLVEILELLLPEAKINFDLNDCDRILRIKGGVFSPYHIIQILLNEGFDCELISK